MKRVAIVQSNYIPWKGYFDLIARADAFVLLDEVQYTRRDWRNRNKIKQESGPQWLTLPVQVKGKYHQRIDETLVADSGWADKHWATIRGAYAKAPHFAAYEEAVGTAYAAVGQMERLSDVNRHLLEVIGQQLGIDTPILWSSDLDSREGKNERLIDLCVAAEATHYLSGPAAQGYMDEEAFAAAGVTVEWMDYDGYPEYPQLHPPFAHGVTALDLLFNTGADAARYMRHNKGSG